MIKKDGIKISDKMLMGMYKGQIDNLKVVANMKLELFNEFGDLKDVREVHNTLTTAAKYGAADQILAAPTLTAKPGWMELGTGTPSSTLLGNDLPFNKAFLYTIDSIRA